MKSRKKDTRYLTSVALMAAVVILLANTPLGMIHLPIIKATTVHIPVILGAVILGPGAGAILGGVFGVCSLISNTMAPTLLSFAFSPFMSMTGIPGALKALWISVGCRVMIGVVSGWLWIGLKRCRVNQTVALPVVGFAGALTNTVFVMGSIYILLASQYAQARSVAVGNDHGHCYRLRDSRSRGCSRHGWDYGKGIAEDSTIFCEKCLTLGNSFFIIEKMFNLELSKYAYESLR